MNRLKTALVAAVAAASMVAGGLVAPPANAMTTARTAPSVAVAAPTAPVDQARVRTLLEDVRTENPEWTSLDDAQLTDLLKSHVTITEESDSGASQVTGAGTGTLWFSHVDVAWWATAGTAAVLLLGASLGLGSIPMWNIMFALIGTFWAAWSAGYCAWFTYSGKRSFGTYRC